MARHCNCYVTIPNTAEICQDLLPVSDVLEKALESVPEEERGSNQTLANLHEGVSLTYSQLHQVRYCTNYI